MRTIILVTVVLCSLALNVATVAIGTVASAMSSVFEAVTGLSSVAGNLDREVKVERAKVVGQGERVKKLEGDVRAKDLRLKKQDEALKAASLDTKLKKQRIGELEAAVKKPTPQDVTYRGKKKMLQEAVEDTSLRVTKRTAAGASRNVAATFGEAIPVIGVGVVVAATAWELKDACDTMTDLHELEVALDPTKAKDASVQEVCGLKVPTKEELWEKVKASPSAAWQMAKDAVPDLPEMPELTMPEMPEIDWKFWD